MEETDRLLLIFSMSFAPEKKHEKRLNRAKCRNMRIDLMPRFPKTRSLTGRWAERVLRGGCESDGRKGFVGWVGRLNAERMKRDI